MKMGKECISHKNSATWFEVKEGFIYFFFLLFFMRIIILLFVLALLVGCNSMDAESCAEQSGTWGMGDYDYVCYFEMADAYESCTDSSQCESECVAYSYDEINGYTYNDTEGTCFPQEPFMGCWDVLKNGEVYGTMCS